MDSGKILSFDDIRGYGFIVPDGGGGDVFVHANELRDEKSVFRPGTAVEYDVVDNGRGPKAYGVRVLAAAPPTEEPVPTASDEAAPQPPAGPAPVPGPAPQPEHGDVLTAREYSRELTELFLDALPELTGAQIVRLRTSLLATARRHGWLEG